MDEQGNQASNQASPSQGVSIGLSSMAEQGNQASNQASSSQGVSITLNLAPPHRPPKRCLACQLCQTRKIKCSREKPQCAACIRAGIPCVPSEPAAPRQRKRPHEALINKVEAMESLLRFAMSNMREIDPASLPQLQHPNALQQSAPAPNPAPAQNDETHGALVTESGGARYMDSKVLATIYADIEKLLHHDTDDEDDAAPEILTPDENADENAGLFLGGDNMSPSPCETALDDLWPDPTHIHQLWFTFVRRVNPLTKIIHVPSLEPLVAESVEGFSRLPKNVVALFFSIYLMAVISMSPKECEVFSGCSRQALLQRFSSGTRMALAQVNYMVNHDFTTLQALVMYLTSLQGRYERHAAWIHNSVAIRMAQKMGLHRDGQRLGLSPFDTEMRRRLWWQIIMLDAKYAMMTGLNDSVLPRGWDTEEPKNINDADMDPRSKEYYQDRDGPTEMVFCLMTSKIARFLVDTPNIEALVLCAEADAPLGGDPQEKSRLRGQLAAVGETLVDVLNKYCDPTHGAVHQLADQVRSQVLQKLTGLATSPQDQPEYGIEIHGDQDNAFKLAVCGLEQEERNCTLSESNGFLWYALINFQVEIVLYVAGQLSERTEGSLVKRAWKQMAGVYHWHPELFDLSKKEHHSLARVLVRAWSKLERVSAEQGRPPPEQPFYIQRLQAMVPAEELTTVQTPPQLAHQFDYAVRPTNPQPQPQSQPQLQLQLQPGMGGMGDMGFDPIAHGMSMPSMPHFNAGPYANGFTSSGMSAAPHQAANLDPGYGQYVPFPDVELNLTPIYQDVYGDDPPQEFLAFANGYGTNGYPFLGPGPG